MTPTAWAIVKYVWMIQIMKKSRVCSVLYVHSNPHTLLLTSCGLACKDRKLVLTLKLLKSQRMLWGRVEWFSLFFDFWKRHIAINWLYFYEFNSKILAIFAKCAHQALAANFYFKKIIETLKMNFLFFICRNLHFTLKNNCKK